MILMKRYEKETGKKAEVLYHTGEFTYRTDGYILWLENLVHKYEAQQKDSAFKSATPCFECGKIYGGHYAMCSRYTTGG
jgi:hypothetical protein